MRERESLCVGGGDRESAHACEERESSPCSQEEFSSEMVGAGLVPNSQVHVCSLFLCVNPEMFTIAIFFLFRTVLNSQRSYSTLIITGLGGGIVNHLRLPTSKFLLQFGT